MCAVCWGCAWGKEQHKATTRLRLNIEPTTGDTIVNMGEDGKNGLGKLNITFSGCGFLGIYHVGVASALKDRAPKLLEQIENFGGASAGALVAGSLLCDISLAESLNFTLRLAERANKLSIGPFHPRFRLTNTLRKVFTRMIPENAYKLCSGKLHISLTRCSDWKNVVVSEFHSNEELVDALVASAHVPFYSGIMPPKFRGEYHVDGGISNNLPQHFDGETITVTPWSGESDICPQDDSNSFNHIMFTNTSIRFSAQNFYRMCRAFFPPDADVLSEMCKQGYKDTVRYLKIHYPEYLVDCAGKETGPSCFNCISTDTEVLEITAADAPILFEKSTETRPTVCNVEEKYWERRLHNELELVKVDVRITEKEHWSCYVIRMFSSLFIKPCFFTVWKITQIAECVILKLPKVYTGFESFDSLLHTINDAIDHYKMYENMDSCTDGCSHELLVSRRTTPTPFESTSVAVDDAEDRPADDENSVDYDTACSECSYVTCQSFSANSDEELDTSSSSSSDTIIDNVFPGSSCERCSIGQVADDQ